MDRVYASVLSSPINSYLCEGICVFPAVEILSVRDSCFDIHCFILICRKWWGVWIFMKFDILFVCWWVIYFISIIIHEPFAKCRIMEKNSPTYNCIERLIQVVGLRTMSTQFRIIRKNYFAFVVFIRWKCVEWTDPSGVWATNKKDPHREYSWRIVFLFHFRVPYAVRVAINVELSLFSAAHNIFVYIFSTAFFGGVFQLQKKNGHISKPCLNDA